MKGSFGLLLTSDVKQNRERNWTEEIAPSKPMFRYGRIDIFLVEIESSAMFEAEVGID